MRPVAVLDLEVYTNYFLVAMQDVRTGRVMTMEMHTEQPALDDERLRTLIRTYRLVSFNGIGYDIPILMYALTGASPGEIKKASDRIILHNLKPWNFEREFNVTVTHEYLDHIDLMEVAPLKGSLKMYGGRMHAPSIQDLPYKPGAMLDELEQIEVREYCKNDLKLTAQLHAQLRPQIALREQMSAQYGLDLRSKSDAQIAEAVMKSEVEKVTMTELKKPGFEPGKTFHYTLPAWMESSGLVILDTVRNAEFMVNDKGSVVMPKELNGQKIYIGTGVYRMGIGGLHSSETCSAHTADDDHILRDVDVASYYPAIILNLNLYPVHIGPIFTTIYRSLVERRLAAKAAGDKVVAEALKICVNGLFGKLGSRHSYVYAPDLMIQVTLTGQLAMLMLIHALNQEGIHVVSANTDGVMIRCRKDCVAQMDAIVKAWETTTGFQTEAKDYDAIYARDVNNYIAIEAGKYDTKLKGVYGPGQPLHKNPTTQICAKAVIDHLTLGADIESRIRSTRDIREFVSVRAVRGGGKFRGKEIGKVVRWYYATEPGVDEPGKQDSLHYCVNNYLVPKTQGAKPAMQLPETFPDDIDYEWYIRESYDMLKEIGATP